MPLRLRRRADGAGAAYCTRVRFRAVARFADVTADVGDGGLVDWTQRLLADRKERLCTSGVSLESLAALTGRS